MRAFFYLHLSGVVLLCIGLYFLLFDASAAKDVSGMMLISVFIGLGGLMMSPYPVVKAIEWMRREGDDS